MTDIELIEKVKTDKDSVALVNLANQHSGAYFDVVNRYAHAYPTLIRADDMSGDKLLNFYQFACAYDPTRGAKFSTFVTQRTDYLCKSLLSDGRETVLDGGKMGAAGITPLFTYETMNGDYSSGAMSKPINLADHSREAQTATLAEQELDSAEIKEVADSVGDKRFARVFKMRHDDGLSWRAIGKRMNLSHEWVRVLYQNNVEKVKRKVREEAA